MPVKLTHDLLQKWFPYGYKGDRQSVSVGLLLDAVQDAAGGGTDYGPQIAALEAAVQQLQDTAIEQAAKITDLETELALHENNGKHWTQSEIRDQADIVAGTKVNEHTNAYVHTTP